MLAKKTVEKKSADFRHSIFEHRKKLDLIKPLNEASVFYHREIEVTLQPNRHLPINIYRPAHINAPYPTIFYIPGTAFVAKETAFTELICTRIAEQSRCQVIVINHRLAPEHPFPEGLEDAYHLIRTIARFAEIFQINKNQMVIIGYSSGGNFAATITLYGKEHGLFFQRQVLISPILDLSQSLTAFKTEFEDKDKVVRDTFTRWFLNLYVPAELHIRNPLLSPFWNEATDLKNLPPTDIFFGEIDRFRSDSEAYYQKLLRANVNVQRVMLKDEDHSFLWYKLDVADSIGARIKISLGLQPIPRPLFTPRQPVTFFMQANAENLNLVVYQKSKKSSSRQLTL